MPVAVTAEGDAWEPSTSDKLGAVVSRTGSVHLHVRNASYGPTTPMSSQSVDMSLSTRPHPSLNASWIPQVLYSWVPAGPGDAGMSARFAELAKYQSTAAAQSAVDVTVPSTHPRPATAHAVKHVSAFEPPSVYLIA